MLRDAVPDAEWLLREIESQQFWRSSPCKLKGAERADQAQHIQPRLVHRASEGGP